MEEGFTTSTGDDGYTMPGTYKCMQAEPRFMCQFALITLNGCLNSIKPRFSSVLVWRKYRADKETRNYSQTGYLCRKLESQ